MSTIKVLVPKGSKPGKTVLSVNANGVQYQVKVPKNKKPGSSFEFKVPVTPVVVAKAQSPATAPVKGTLVAKAQSPSATAPVKGTLVPKAQSPGPATAPVKGTLIPKAQSPATAPVKGNLVPKAQNPPPSIGAMLTPPPVENPPPPSQTQNPLTGSSSYDIEMGKEGGGTSKSKKMSNFAPHDVTQTIIQACNKNATGLTYAEMVLVVWNNRKGKKFSENCTVFRFDMKTVDALFSIFDINGDGVVSAEEMAKAMERPDVKEYITSLKNEKLNKLTRITSTTSKTHEFGKDILGKRSRTESMSKSEWNEFITILRNETMTANKQKVLLQNRKYMGLGLEPGEPSDAFFTKWFGVPKGYWEDLVFYACNNHSLLAFFYSDPCHPYTKRYKFIEFLGISGTLVFGYGFIVLFACSPVGKNEAFQAFISLIFVSIPNGIYRTLMFYFFGAPCCVMDKSTTGEARQGFAAACKSFLGSTAVFFSLGWIFFTCLIGGILISHNISCLGGDAAFSTVFNISHYWVVWFFNLVMFEFNPYPSVCKRLSFLRRLGMPIGEWRRQKDLVENAIKKEIFNYGDEDFYLSQSAQRMRRNSLATMHNDL